MPTFFKNKKSSPRVIVVEKKEPTLLEKYKQQEELERYKELKRIEERRDKAWELYQLKERNRQYPGW